MRLHIFQSSKGDCLALEAADGALMLCDGGMASSMKATVRQHLGRLRELQRKLEYVYVSHIDQDHISGVLQLLEDELSWRVFEHHRANGDNRFRKPSFPRPPEIGGIWHNAFRDQVDGLAGDIEDMLAASAPVLLGTGVPRLAQLGREYADIVTSIPEALKVSQLASPTILNIPVNKLPNVSGPAKLLFHREGQPPIPVGSMLLTIVGPSEDELKKLRAGWKNWLSNAKNEDKVRAIRAEMKRRAEQFAEGAFAVNPFDLRKWEGIPDFKGVTVPNIASLMFMAEEGGKRILLTGDSQQDIILKGLRLTGFLEDNGLHLDVLKVQHHASEHNVDPGFCREVSADHYVFCGNGSHGNPEPSVIQFIFNSRVGDPQRRALAPEAEGRPFEFWFSTASQLQPEGSEQHENMKAVEGLVADMESHSDGLLRAHFNIDDVLVLEVS